MNSLENLIAERTKTSYYNIRTTFRTESGKVLLVNTNMLKQLRFGSKVIEIKGKKYNLIWKKDENLD